MLVPLRVSCLLLTLSLLPHRSTLAQETAPWQQRVRYEMDVTLLADQHRLLGEQRLTYYNNSSDTLREVFYHLYFNAFHPQSMMAERNRHLPDPDPRIVPRIFNLEPEEVGYQHIRALTQDGRPVAHEVYGTTMRVELAEPILPGDSSVFDMRFETQIPLITRRAGRDNNEGIDYSMAQWYPKMAMYDHMGWHTDPYVGREFYGPFGTFDVRLTLPASYVVGGTGVVMNSEEVGHGYQRDTTLVSSNGRSDSLTWHFHAENVHDFAWAADPEYVHDRFTDDRGLVYHVLYLPDYTEVWSNQRKWLPALVEFFGSNYARYPYPQFTVAQAGDGGMEYPMITFITGDRSPGSLLGTTAHELAHEWFYGILGTNETDYAWMDEGMANYISTEALAAINSQNQASHAGALLSLIRAQHYNLFEPLDTPSDWFTTNSGYGVAAYSGGQAVAEMLGYVISEPLRDRWLREIFRRFMFRHPYPKDFEKAAEDVSGLQLDWFFDQFLSTRWKIDYDINQLRSQPNGTGGWTTTITLERHTDTVLPVDLVLRLEDGTFQWVNVPLTIMAGHKPIPEGGIVGEPWPWTSPEHTITLTLPSRATAAYLDPLLMTPDANRLNNTSTFPTQAAFLQPPIPNWQTYSIGYRPLAQYARGYGVALGAQARGTYLFGQLEAKGMLKLWPQILFGEGEAIRELPGVSDSPSFLDGIDFELYLSSPITSRSPFLEASVSSRKHFGFLESTLALEQRLGRWPLLQDSDQRVSLVLRHEYGTHPRTYSPTTLLPLLPQHTLSARVGFSTTRGDDLIRVEAELGSSLEEDPAFGGVTTHVLADAVRGERIGPLTGLAKLRIGLGAPDLLPSRLHRLGLATSVESWRNDAFRTLAAGFEDPVDEGHFVPFAGVGPVAYALGTLPAGRHILAGSLTLSTAHLFSNAWLAPLSVQAFSGIGEVWNGPVADVFQNDAPLLADAGFGVTYDVSRLAPLQRWIAQSDVLSTLRFMAKIPVWVSKPGLLEEDDPIGWRWLIGAGIGG